MNPKQHASQAAAPPATAQAWEWRLALNHGFWDIDGKPTFHAHGTDNLAACRLSFGLVQSIAEPNEGSHLCPYCAVVVRMHPHGRSGGDR